MDSFIIIVIQIRIEATAPPPTQYYYLKSVPDRYNFSKVSSPKKSRSISPYHCTIFFFLSSTSLFSCFFFFLFFFNTQHQQRYLVEFICCCVFVTLLFSSQTQLLFFTFTLSLTCWLLIKQDVHTNALLAFTMSYLLFCLLLTIPLNL